MDLSYRNYCKNMHDRYSDQHHQQMAAVAAAATPSHHDYDEAIQSQSINQQQLSPATTIDDFTTATASHLSHESMAEKSINLYIKNFDNGGSPSAAAAALIRARQLDEMQSCDTSGAHEASMISSGHQHHSGNTINSLGVAANNNNQNSGSTNNSGGTSGGGGGVVANDDSSEARNYASSDDMNQTTSSERDDKLGSGSEDEGEL